MTWGELKELAEKDGVTDETVICVLVDTWETTDYVEHELTSAGEWEVL